MSAPPYAASTIARWFLAWAEGEEEASLSNLKLQKLLYYSQGHHLALRGRPLFSDNIEAWSHGPVVADVYHQYKHFGGSAIDATSFFDFGSVDRKTTDLLIAVWSKFGALSAWKLRDMTHSERPWKSTFKENRYHLVIPTAAMEDYFRAVHSGSKKKK